MSMPAHHAPPRRHVTGVVPKRRPPTHITRNIGGSSVSALAKQHLLDTYKPGETFTIPAVTKSLSIPDANKAVYSFLLKAARSGMVAKGAPNGEGQTLWQMRDPNVDVPVRLRTTPGGMPGPKARGKDRKPVERLPVDPTIAPEPAPEPPLHRLTPEMFQQAPAEPQEAPAAGGEHDAPPAADAAPEAPQAVPEAANGELMVQAMEDMPRPSLRQELLRQSRAMLMLAERMFERSHLLEKAAASLNPADLSDEELMGEVASRMKGKRWF